MELYRAVYTRCYVGVDFYSRVSTKEGQQLFNTSGNMNLPRETISFIETEIRRDIFNAGMRPFLGDAFRYLHYNGVSVLLHYRWLSQKETGSKEYGLTKALIGCYESHPMAYCNSSFFDDQKYYYDFPDANGLPIHEFKQLHSYKSDAPTLFNPIRQDDFVNSPAISFEEAAGFVLAKTDKTCYTSDRVRAAVYHLVNQFSNPNEGQRIGIAYKGTTDQIRHLFAAIGYAFSAKAAQNISFSIGLPPVGYSYSFSTDALVGWNIEDPALTKLNRMPSNLIMLDDLHSVSTHDYYSSVTLYEPEFKDFILTSARKSDDIAKFPDLYALYLRFGAYTSELISSASCDIGQLSSYIKQYIAGKLYYRSFFRAALSAASKAEPTCDYHIDLLIRIYEDLEIMIVEEVLLEEVKTKEELLNELKGDYISRFSNIFASILSNTYHFSCSTKAKKLTEYMEDMTELRGESRIDWVRGVALDLIRDEVAKTYAFSNKSNRELIISDQAWEDQTYSRLIFVCNLIWWCNSESEPIPKNIAAYANKSLNDILLMSLSDGCLNFKIFHDKLQQFITKTNLNQSLVKLYGIFYDLAVDVLRSNTSNCVFEIEELIYVNDSLEKIINSTSLGNDSAVVNSFKDHCLEIYCRMFSLILEDNLDLFNTNTSRNPLEYFSMIAQRNSEMSLQIAQYLTKDDVVVKYSFLSQLSKSFHLRPQFIEKVIYPRLSFVNHMMKKSNILITNSLAQYICKSFDAVIYCSSNYKRQAVYNSIFLPFLDSTSGDMRGVKIFLDCEYSPKFNDKKQFWVELENVFLYDFEEKLLEIGRKQFAGLDEKIVLTRQYFDSRIEEGVSADRLLSLYLESINLDNDRSVFYYSHSLRIFKDEAHPVLCDFIVDLLLMKSLTQRSYDEKYMQLVYKFMEEVKALEGYDTGKPQIWKKSCGRVDAHLASVFELREWYEICSNEKSQFYLIAKYFIENRLYLPNTGKMTLYVLINKYNGYEESTRELTKTLGAFISAKALFMDINSNYRNVITQTINSTKMTGEILYLILRLFDFEAQLSSEILIGSCRINTKSTTNVELAFFGLCKYTLALYEGNRGDDNYKKFLNAVATNYLDLWRKIDTKLLGVFYLSLVLLFENDYYMKIMTDERAGNNAHVFCRYCIVLEASYHQSSPSLAIQKAWQLTEHFCNEFKMNQNSQYYDTVYKELGKAAKKSPGINTIRRWLEPDKKIKYN